MAWTDPEIVVIAVLGVTNVLLVILQLRQNGRIAEMTEHVGNATLRDLERRPPRFRVELIGHHVILSGALEVALRVTNEGTEDALIDQTKPGLLKSVDSFDSEVRVVFYPLKIWRESELDHGLPSGHIFGGTAPDVRVEGGATRFIGCVVVGDATKATDLILPVMPVTGRGDHIVVTDLADAYDDWKRSEAGRAVSARSATESA